MIHKVTFNAFSTIFLIHRDEFFHFKKQSKDCVCFLPTHQVSFSHCLKLFKLVSLKRLILEFQWKYRCRIVGKLQCSLILVICPEKFSLVCGGLIFKWVYDVFQAHIRFWKWNNTNCFLQIKSYFTHKISFFCFQLVDAYLHFRVVFLNLMNK